MLVVTTRDQPISLSPPPVFVAKCEKTRSKLRVGVSQIPSMSKFGKVDPKEISRYKVDPKKWIPKN